MCQVEETPNYQDDSVASISDNSPYSHKILPMPHRYMSESHWYCNMCPLDSSPHCQARPISWNWSYMILHSGRLNIGRYIETTHLVQLSNCIWQTIQNYIPDVWNVNASLIHATKCHICESFTTTPSQLCCLVATIAFGLVRMLMNWLVRLFCLLLM